MAEQNKKSALDKLMYYLDLDNRFQDAMEIGGDKLRGAMGLDPIAQEEKDAYRAKMAAMAKAGTPVSAGMLDAVNPAKAASMARTAAITADNAVDAIKQSQALGAAPFGRVLNVFKDRSKALAPFEAGKAIKNAKIIRGR